MIKNPNIEEETTSYEKVKNHGPWNSSMFDFLDSYHIRISTDNNYLLISFSGACFLGEIRITKAYPTPENGLNE